MRIAATSESLFGANYRLLSPLLAMERRGHEIILPDRATGLIRRRDLLSSDVVLVYRSHDAVSRKLLREAREHGVGIVWDVDDDMRNSPFSPYGKHAGLHRRKQIYDDSLNAARLADIVITSTDVVRDLYAKAGIGRIEVLENYLLHGTADRRTRRHTGFIIGWVAGIEHELDARALAIPDTLARIQHQHPEAQVECIGVDLALADRYTHAPRVLFEELPAHMASWDIGLAPIAETVFNAARSNIKVKEYAASRVPWLASARGPYADLGEQHGGRLVDDDCWFAAIDGLISDRRARKRLARAGRSWAKGETIAVVADRYEEIFVEAASRGSSRSSRSASIRAVAPQTR